MTDAPIKTLIGDLARPFATYVVSAASAAGIVIVALRVENGNDGAIFLGAAGLIVGTLIGARTAENINAAKRSAEVEIAKTNAPTA